MNEDLTPTRVDFIVPAYNEGEGITQTYERLVEVLKADGFCGAVVFIDDGSTDNTWSVLQEIAQKDGRVKLIRFSRNFGHQAAITAGLAHSQGDYSLILDADLQDPPELIDRMLPLAGQGYDIIYGVRTRREGETPAKKGTASLFYRTINFFSPVAIPPDAGDFRLVSARARAFFLQVQDRSRLNREIWSWIGLKQIGLPYERPPRAFGTSKYNWKRMLRLAFDGLTATGTGPLWVCGGLALLLLLISVILLVSCHALAAGLAFTSALVLAAMTIAGIYIGRLYHQARRRPTYLIAEVIKQGDNGGGLTETRKTE